MIKCRSNRKVKLIKSDSAYVLCDCVTIVICLSAAWIQRISFILCQHVREREHRKPVYCRLYESFITNHLFCPCCPYCCLSVLRVSLITEREKQRERELQLVHLHLYFESLCQRSQMLSVPRTTKSWLLNCLAFCLRDKLQHSLNQATSLISILCHQTSVCNVRSFCQAVL